jgi:2-polyprenyl-3-methyl-5-hydroxy-6-metoxy-1,4-benzoquinol methylase
LAHLRILDVASGGGDVARALARPGWAVDGCDFSPTAVAHAQRRGGRFFIHDALADPIPEQYDALTCSLFVHHLSEDQTIQLFRRFAESSARFIVISDLNRCRTGLFLAYVVSRLLTRSPVVHYDGPVSVRAAFTLPEVRNLAHQAGLHGAQVRRCWPFRWLLTWERP